MLLLFLFSPVSFDADYDISDKSLLLNDTIDYYDYDVYNISQPKIDYPATTDKRRKYLKDLKELYTDLMNNYDKDLSPVYSNSANPLGITIPPILVNVTVSLVFMLGLDDTGQILHINMFVDFTWTDDRLSWNSTKYSDIKSMDIRKEEVWMPDVSGYNCQYIIDNTPKAQQSVHVNYKGVANYRGTLDMHCFCSLELDDYPFDRQTCDVPFFAFQHTIDKLTLGARIAPSDGWLIPSDAWSIVNLTHDSFNYSMGEGFDTVGCAMFVLELERSYGFFIVFIIFPTTLLSAICILAMFHEKIDRQNQLEKIGIGIASLAAVTLILNIIADEIPRKKTTSVIGKFILANLCTLTVAILVVIVNPIDILTSQLSKCRKQSNKITAVSLATDSLPRISGITKQKKSGLRIEMCLLSNNIILILFEAAVFTFFGLVASFWSS